MKVIIDTDPGTDDAMALLLFLYADKIGLIKIEAITSGQGNTDIENTTKNIVKLLEVAGRTDIPVYKGSANPIILMKNPLDRFHGKDGFGDLPDAKEPDMSIVKEGFAPVKIGEMVSSKPNEITLICLGPLTNIALSLKQFPKMGESIKEVFIMGGNDSGVGNISSSAEFNFFSDPEAAYIVLECIKAPITILTWEASMKSQIPIDWRFESLPTKAECDLLKFITPAEKSVYDKQKLEFWNAPDLVLAACLLCPEKVIKLKKEYFVTVELHGEHTRGQMVLDHLEKNPTNATVILEVNIEEYKKVVEEAVGALKVPPIEKPSKKSCTCKP